MSTFVMDQAQFMIAAEQTVTSWNIDQAERYANHIKEEARELKEAFDEKDYVKAVDGAVDSIVVALGFLLSLGVSPYRAWDAVHAANMRKVDGSCGDMVWRPDGQLGKPINWYGPEPELKTLVDEVKA